MKQRGQWIILLWIAAVLLYAQAELSLIDSTLADNPPSAFADDFDAARNASAPHLPAPAFAPVARTLSTVAPDPGARTGLLPFAQGPPSLV
jgi:hypothetical protein